MSFLGGGGRMGALIRTHDWAATSLGPVDWWPQSLRTALSIMLNSLHPMFLAWGPQRVFFYNDGYAAILGAKHPEALGRRFDEVWHDIWRDIDPLVARALAGEATWHEDFHLVVERNGFPEDTWYTFSYSPIRDESGGIGGMFCACTETTAKVLAERALRASEARWRGLFERMHEGFALCEMVYGPDGIAMDYRYLEVNAAVERLSGIPPAALVGRLASQAIPGLERFWVDTYAKVVETGEPAQFEYRVASLNRWFEVLAYRTEPGRFASLFLNVTERRAAAARQALMAREVDHRAKNALAVVQAMLRLTRADSVTTYAAAVEGRIGALARAHALLADASWTGAALRLLLTRELAPFLAPGGVGTAQRVALAGPDLLLPAGAAQGLAMVVHELATNAMKHGALSSPDGEIVVDWEADCHAGASALRLRWTERGGPPIAAPPERQGFGARMIEQTLHHQLGGKVAFDWAPPGLCCRIVVPLGTRN